MGRLFPFFFDSTANLTQIDTSMNSDVHLLPLLSRILLLPFLLSQARSAQELSKEKIHYPLMIPATPHGIIYHLLFF